MRRLALAVSVALALAAASSAPASPLFVLTGRGWGHGVGMSQWGAYGMATGNPAATHADILGRYYPGTGFETRPSVQVRVLLAAARPSLTIASAAPFRVESTDLAAGPHGVTPTDDGGLRVEGVDRVLASPIRFAPGAAPLELKGLSYRGAIDVRREDGRLSAVNELERERYLYGVVPREVPYTWPTAVLEAQAIAARSWLMRSLRDGWFDVYDDTRSQVYGGIDAEKGSTTAAVHATSDRVLVYQGAVAQAFYHSSSGGLTASSVDTWGGDVPYLQSVRDPTDDNPANPHRRWVVTLTARRAAARLRSGPLRDLVAVRNSSDRVASVTLEAVGGTSSLSGRTIQARLGLKSTRFWIGVLSITPRRNTIAWGQRVRLAVVARGVSGTSLQKRPPGGVWEDRKAVSGSTTVSVAPRASTLYRLSSPSATGATVRVRVTPRIFFALKQRPGALTGVVRPRLAGSTVQIQRQRADGSWAKVARAALNADGVFRARFKVRAGVYRARVAPPEGSGLVLGFSPTLTIATS